MPAATPRFITAKDLSAVDGRSQVTGPADTFDAIKDADVELCEVSVAACLEFSREAGHYTMDLANAALDYIASTRVLTNYDTQGYFATPIPPTLAAFYKVQAPWTSGAMWEPKAEEPLFR